MNVTLTIDGISVSVPQGTTILDAAVKAGITIPTLCHDPLVEAFGACGLCVVEAEGSPRLLRACAIQVAQDMRIHTGTQRVRDSRRFALSLLLSDHLGDCIAPCSLACPAGTDCQGYVGLLANGETEQAARLIREKIPFPSSIGRICPHPCETACRRKLVEQPIAIAALKSVAGDFSLAQGIPLPDIQPGTGKRVAVVGGGPGGLTAAYFLRCKGHAVTVYDQMPQMGGMLRYGIPEYRLPKAVLQQETDLLTQMGISFKNDCRIGTDLTFDALREQYDATVLAIGAWTSGKMRVKGEDLRGVLGGIDFLREAALRNTPQIGARVAVCGGGNTAMDACRTAVRLGATEVFVLYRRTREEMPAEEIEIEEAIEEGVCFRFLTNPVEILGENGRVTGIRLQEMTLGEPDASGRRRPVPVADAFEDLPLDTVIMAIGQSPDLTGFEALEHSKWNTIIADSASFSTNLDGVFAVGDATNNGADIAISAIGEAQKATNVIDSFLAGETVPYRKPFVSERTVTAADFAKKSKQVRAVQNVLAPETRKSSFAAIAETLPQSLAQSEAARCLECGCLKYHNCKLLRLAREYGASPAAYGVSREKHETDESHPYLRRETDKCVLCGLCVRVCHAHIGASALGFAGRGFSTVVTPEFYQGLADSACIACGQCVALCPTGALTEKVPFKKSVPLREETVSTTCPGCAQGCRVLLHKVGSTITRAIPAENGAVCAQGRFGFALAQEPKRVMQTMLGINPCDFEAACAELQSALQQYRGKIHVLISEDLPGSQVKAAAQFAQSVGSTYRFQPERVILQDIRHFDTDFLPGEGFHSGANAQFLEQTFQIPSYRKNAIPGGEAVLVLGADAPADITGYGFLCVYGYHPGGADVFFPAPHYAERQGTFTAADGTVRTITPAIFWNNYDLEEILNKIPMF